MQIDIKTACERLLEHDNILIFTHQKPDGDTLGAAFALLWSLEGLGKHARVACTDGFPKRYSFIYDEYKPDESFDVEYVVAVDISTAELIGPEGTKYADRVDLCIDHHRSNSLYAKETLLAVEAPAACEVMFDVISCLNVRIDAKTASALFTGISTDTGCFKYAGVTAKTHMTAAKLIELGAEHAKINKLMFDTKSRGMLMVDRMLIETIKFYLDDRCAVAVIPRDICEKYGLTDEDLEGTSSFPVRIEGVVAGVTIRDRKDDTYRVSLRTVRPFDASMICAQFGGGGHLNAAGCTVKGELDDILSRILEAVKDELERHA